MDCFVVFEKQGRSRTTRSDKKGKADMIRKGILIILLLAVAVGVGYFAKKDEKKTTKPQEEVSTPQPVLSKNTVLEQPLGKENFRDHVRMKCDNALSVRRDWIPYYYRHKKQEEIIPALLTLANEADTDDGVNHFFAQLLKQYPEKLNELKEIAKKMGGDQKAIADAIISEAEDWHPVNFSLPIDHARIWAEYSVIGAEELVTQYAEYLNPEKFSLDDESKRELFSTFFEAAKRYSPVYYQLRRMKDWKTGAHQEAISELYTQMTEEIYKPSDSLLVTGNNFFNSKEMEKALAAYFEGLQIAQDNAYLYGGIGGVYIAQKKYEEAKESINFVKDICPEKLRMDLLKKLGDIHLKENEPAKALGFYLEILDSVPHFSQVLFSVAQTYEKLHDVAQAEKYYREYLDHEPGFEDEKVAMAFFERNNIDPPVVVASLEVLLQKRKFDELERLLQDVLVEREVNSEGVLKIYDLLCEIGSGGSNFSANLAPFTEWVQQRPESYVANASIGQFYLRYAWNARGGGTSKTVSAEGWERFHDRIRLAGEYLTKAYAINPSQSLAPAKLIEVANLHPDWPDEEAEKWFQKAIAADPSDCEAYLTKSQFLDPKWGGDRQEQLEFGRDTFKNAPKDSMAPLVLAKAHWAAYYAEDDATYFKRPEVWRELKELYTELVRRFPKAMIRHNWFAKTACLAGDFETARQEFDVIQQRWGRTVWANHEEFEYFKKKAFSSE